MKSKYPLIALVGCIGFVGGVQAEQGSVVDKTKTAIHHGVEATEHGIKRGAHSVLTTDLVDAEGHPTRAALDRVLGFFRERLKEMM